MYQSLSLLFITLTVLFLPGLVSTQQNQQQRNKVQLKNNGYETLLIAIGENVQQNDFPGLLERIKEVFTDASSELFTATKRRAYFRNITILVPKKWNGTFEETIDEKYSRANVVIDLPSATYGHSPYVVRNGGCGEAGLYMHLTPSLILNSGKRFERIYGRAAKSVVHEWAHLRWGLFDEYANYVSDENHFYHSSDGKVEATRCALSIKGSAVNRFNRNPCQLDPKTLLPEKECRFFPDYFDTDSTASYMFYQFIDSVNGFCEHNPDYPLKHHNSESNSDQNRFCNGRSAWEIMETHPDFADENPSINGSEQSLSPHFRVKQMKEVAACMVLVLDVSGSMQDKGYIHLLNSAVRHIVLNVVSSRTLIGMVTFDSNARILKPLELLTSTVLRRHFANRVPSSAAGGTALGLGVKKGIEVLECLHYDPITRNCLTRRSPAGCRILVVSDGEENAGNPRLRKVKGDVIRKNIILDTILYSNKGDHELIKLSDVTGGIVRLYPAALNQKSSALLDALADMTESADDGENSFQTLDSGSVELKLRQSYNGSVLIDDSIGLQTSFAFLWTKPSNPGGVAGIRVFLSDPDGEVINATELNANSRIMSFAIPNITKSGVWSYGIENMCMFGECDKQIVYYQILSRTQDAAASGGSGGGGGGSDKKSHVVTVYAFVNARKANFGTGKRKAVIIFAKATIGDSPLLDSNVTAVVEQGSLSTKVTLRDNGLGADLMKDDGIYSAYFTNIKSNGQLTVKVFANDGGNKAKFTTSSALLRHRAPVKVFSDGTEEYDKAVAESKSVNSFQRVSSGGYVDVTGVSGKSPEQLFPPSQIKDLSIASVSSDKTEVTLQFTAVGATYDTGRASSYDIRYSSSAKDLYLDKGFETAWSITVNGSTGGQNIALVSNLTQPQKAGEKETFKLRLDANNRTVFAVGVRAINAGRNKGDPSNPVVVSVNPTFDNGASAKTKDDGLTTLAIVAIIACSTVFVLIVIISIAVCVKRKSSSVGV